MKMPVVVGVDGSLDARRAVSWAAEEATRRDARLKIVHACVWSLYQVAPGPAADAQPGAGLQQQAQLVLAEAAAEAATTSPTLRVETSLVAGAAATRLIAASREAALLVVGHKDVRDFNGPLLGSVVTSVMSHAACPVVVVPRKAVLTGPVLVGMDGPQRTQHMLEAAFSAAQRLSTGVLALRSIGVPPPNEEATTYRDRLDSAEEEARASVEQELASARARYPDVPVQVRLGGGSAAGELVMASEGASLLVVGARSLGGFAERVTGTANRTLIYSAHCPVMVDR